MDYWIEKALALNKEIICLRCSFCCYAYQITLPDGSNKPENSFCPYSNIKNGQGICKIYDTRPWSCQIFVMPGPDKTCALGTAMKAKFGPDFIMREK
jgi:hypothetical protein